MWTMRNGAEEAEGPGGAGPAAKQPGFCTESAGKPQGGHDPSNL